MTHRDHLSTLRQSIERQYRDHPTGCGGSFEEILCYELHGEYGGTGGPTFCCLAEKWGVSLPVLGELIWDHCKRLEPPPVVNHGYHRG
jgi:hypothetical protein